MLLARTVCHCTLDELMTRMSAEEFALWAAEYERDPWDEQRADLRAGIVASVAANAAGGRKDGGAFAPIDFMPYTRSADVEAEDPKQAEERRIREFLEGLNGNVR